MNREFVDNEIKEYVNNKKCIQIGYICGPKSFLYIKFSIKTILKTVSDPKKISIIIGKNCNDCDFRKFGKLKNKFKSFNIYDVQNNKKHPSLNHGLSLDKLFWKYFHEDYGMVVDSDIAFLKKNWDLDLIKLINYNKNTIIIGSGNPEKNICNGLKKIKYKKGDKFRNFPSVYCPFFKTKKLKECGITWQPWIYDIINREYINIKSIQDIINGLKKLSYVKKALKKNKMTEIEGHSTVKFRCKNGYEKILGMDKGEICRADTGFFLPIIIKKNNYNGIYFKTYPFTFSEKKNIFNNDEIEYIWKNRNELGVGNYFNIIYKENLFFTHLGQSSKREFNTDYLSKIWIKCVKRYIY